MVMRLSLLLSVVAIFMLSGLLRAEDVVKDAKEVTLTGTLTCAKCDLKKADACATVLSVKEGDKTTLYYLSDTDATKGLHEKICMKPTHHVSVTGVVSEKDGKEYIAPTKVDMPKHEGHKHEG